MREYLGPDNRATLKSARRKGVDRRDVAPTWVCPCCGAWLDMDWHGLRKMTDRERERALRVRRAV
jgi:hypothetical protein